MIQYHIYPGGRRRIVTFSYDDGAPQDERLIALFDRAGVRATFHLNGMNYRGMDASARAAVRARYAKHEIACHTLQHGWPSRMPLASVVRETMEDRQVLEEIAGYPVTGMSYPCGSYDRGVEDAMAACGIQYALTTQDTMRFCLPEDWMAWHPTCHHKQAAALIDPFLASLESEWSHPLFYIWGHSHEFRCEEDWAAMQQILDRLGGNDRIWYATNGEIYQYMQAQRALRITVDERVLYNPTAIPVWVEKDKKQVICIPAGEIVRLS